ncbi:hypothetical protein ES332_D11G165600v1 [Gossypium tomentosum]|uniref:Uncharacterized protein n=1 Tax=Gossypium tomentosum TaxID=34277 RepID=A0A5D2IPS0_GOSTO|nr:hypothetical protein ES332_D11G165600v1 [Gossypium tomentosum]
MVLQSTILGILEGSVGISSGGVVHGSGWAYLTNTKTTRQNFHSLIMKTISDQRRRTITHRRRTTATRSENGKKNIKQEEEKNVYGVWVQR